MITRGQIIEKLTAALEPLPYIYAFWLEGSDAVGTIDDYSDIDLCVDVEDRFEQQSYDDVEKALSEISEIDYRHHEPPGHPKLRQRVYHLSGTSEYLMLDFNWQLHSRPPEETSFIKNSRVENARIIFDKAGVVRFVDYNPANYKAWNDARLMESKYRYTQHARVTKYILRKQYLEAYVYYNRYVLEPLVNDLRLLYTPANADLHLLHISQHLPEAELRRLEYFARIPTLDDMAVKLPEAEAWFTELIGRIENEQG
jgi:predicted nucleotidyltransferase